jgi:Golgi apparatus protein 1
MISQSEEAPMTKLLRITPILSAIFSLALFSLPSHAFTEGACRDDVQKLCADVKPGGGAIADCLKAHDSEVSQACKDNVAEGKEKIKEKAEAIKTACAQDLKKYCANVTPGEGREMACLRSYSDKLSDSCKAQMPKHMMHKGMGHPGQDGNAQNDGQPPEQPESK